MDMSIEKRHTGMNIVLDTISNSILNNARGNATATVIPAVVTGVTATGNSNLAGFPMGLLLVPIFFAISFFYSSVGFGGGSSYIAILVLVGISLFTVPPIALILNIVASSMSFTNYARAGHLSIKFALPFLSSVPFAFIAGTMVLPQHELALVFAAALFAASASLFVSSQMNNKNNLILFRIIDKVLIMARKENGSHRVSTLQPTDNWHQQKLLRLILIGLPIGATLGTIAGLVGIGGGIWLSPLLILAGLADPKRAAATASLFILANSVSGFIAHSITKPIDFSLLVPLAIAVFAGGFIGSQLGAFRFDHNKIRRIVASLVFLAGMIIILKSVL